MNDTEPYQRVLGLEEPRFVEWVEMSLEPRRGDIRLVHREGVKWSCPQREGPPALAYCDHAPNVHLAVSGYPRWVQARGDEALTPSTIVIAVRSMITLRILPVANPL